MTLSISKLTKIAVYIAAIVPFFALNLSSVRAEAPDVIGDITSLTEKIANRNPLQPAPVEESIPKSSDSEASSIRNRSLECVNQGYEAEEAGKEKLAMQLYIAAAKLDPSNGYAFLLLGRLVGNNPDGIALIEKSAQLFHSENDSQGLELAMMLLKSANAGN